MYERTRGRELLVAWLDRVEWTKGEVAGLLGIHPSELSHLISGKRRPTLPLAVVIEDHTGIPAKSWVPLRSGKSAGVKKQPLKTATLA